MNQDYNECGEIVCEKSITFHSVILSHMLTIIYKYAFIYVGLVVVVLTK